MNLSELTKKLSAIDIQDLQKIDYKKLLEVFRKNPGINIRIAVICVTVLICPNLYLRRRTELKTLKQETVSLEKKIRAIDAYDAEREKLAEFIDALPGNIEEDDLVNHLTGFAESRHVSIQSLLPAKKVSESLYDLTNIILNVSAKKYKDIWLFVHDIEKSPYAIRIDTWAGQRESSSLRGRRRRQATPAIPDESRINVKLEITSITFKK